MKYIWQNLPKPMNCFTVRNATMRNLNNGKIVQSYSANTKIVVVQKCVTPIGTYYRTESAKHHYLNYAFEASAFGLPNEFAPSVPSPEKKPLTLKSQRQPSAPPARLKRKQTSSQPAISPKDGEARPSKGWFKRLFGRG